MYHHPTFYKNRLVSGPTEINHIFIFCLINFISQIKSSWDRNLKSWISVIWLYVSRPRVLSFSRVYPDYFPPPQITEHGQIRNLEIGARQYWGGVVCKTPSRAFLPFFHPKFSQNHARTRHIPSRSVVYLQNCHTWSI